MFEKYEHLKSHFKTLIKGEIFEVREFETAENSPKKTD